MRLALDYHIPVIPKDNNQDDKKETATTEQPQSESNDHKDNKEPEVQDNIDDKKN